MSMQRERLSGKTLKRDAIVRTIWRHIEEGITRPLAFAIRLTSNNKIIDAQMAFFGTGCIINEQVILQDQEGIEQIAA